MSSPTKLTITSITADSGSSTQPRSTLRGAELQPGEVDCLAHRDAVRPAADHMRQMRPATAVAKTPANQWPARPTVLRFGCFSSAMTPAATMGSAGISHRISAIGRSCHCGVNEIDLLHQPLTPSSCSSGQDRWFGVAIDGDHQPQSDRRFSRGHGNGEDGKHHPR